MDTAKFDDAYFKAADKKKGASKKTEGEFFNEVRTAWYPHAGWPFVRAFKNPSVSVQRRQQQAQLPWRS